MRAGSVLSVATLDAAPGSRVELRDVLLVSDGEKVTVGSPTVPDAMVVAEVVEHGKGRKVVSFKYKAKVRSRRKRGHRQGFTKLAVQEIHHAGAVAKAPERRPAVAEAVAEPEAPAPRRRARARAVEEAVAAAPENVEEAPAPARRRRAAAPPAAEPEASESAQPAPRRRRPRAEPKE